MSTEVAVRPVEVGDLFEASWGYDQTNIDYYKVVRCTDKTAWLVRIGESVVEGSEGFMCEHVLPNPEVELCDHCLSGPGGYQHDLSRPAPENPWEPGAHEYKATPTRHRIQWSDYRSGPVLKVRSFAWAYRISGTESSYQSHYA